jgi:hypothetical protein
MHTSHPQAGWENRCQQSTTHSAGKEPDKILMRSRRPTNSSPLWDLLENCSTMSYTLLFAAHKELVYKYKCLCEVLFISVEWLFHGRSPMVSHTTERAFSEHLCAMPSCKTVLPGPKEYSFSSPSCSFQPWKVPANGIILIALENIWEPKKKFPYSEQRALSPYAAWPAHVILDLRSHSASYWLRVILTRMTREDSGHLST